MNCPLQSESSIRAALHLQGITIGPYRWSPTDRPGWPSAPAPQRARGGCCHRGGTARGKRPIEMCRARSGPRPGNVGVASALSGRLKGEDAPWAKRSGPPLPTWGSTSGSGRTARAASARTERWSSGPTSRTGPPTSTGCSSAPAPARWSSSTRSATSARSCSPARSRTETPAPTCPDTPRGRPVACSRASPRPMPSTPWIGNTYLDDFGRDSPASLNSTGDM